METPRASSWRRKEAIMASDISDLKLEAMRSDLESDRVERKRSAVRQATPEEEYRLAERRRARDLPFDLRSCSGATIDDLDIGYIEAQYLPRAVAQDVLDENRRPLMQQLRSLRLLADEIPTWGALFGFGRDPWGWMPGAYVQFVRIDGDTITDPILDQHQLTGRLEDVLRRLDELLKLNIRTGVDLQSGAREIRLPTTLLLLFNSWHSTLLCTVTMKVPTLRCAYTGIPACRDRQPGWTLQAGNSR